MLLLLMLVPPDGCCLLDREELLLRSRDMARALLPLLLMTQSRRSTSRAEGSGREGAGQAVSANAAAASSLLLEGASISVEPAPPRSSVPPLLKTPSSSPSLATLKFQASGGQRDSGGSTKDLQTCIAFIPIRPQKTEQAADIEADGSGIRTSRKELHPLHLQLSSAQPPNMAPVSGEERSSSRSSHQVKA